MSVPAEEIQFLCQSVLWIVGANARAAFRTNQTNSLAEHLPPGRQPEPSQRSFPAPSSARKSRRLPAQHGEVTVSYPHFLSTAVLFFLQKKRRSGPSLKLRFCNFLIRWLCRPLLSCSQLIYCSPWARLLRICIEFIKKGLHTKAFIEIVHKLDSRAILKRLESILGQLSQERREFKCNAPRFGLAVPNAGIKNAERGHEYCAKDSVEGVPGYDQSQHGIAGSLDPIQVMLRRVLA